MKEKKECKIVQDLLPNYIEKFTSKETNDFIENHLKECANCKEAYEKMKPEIENNHASDIEIDYMKKYNKKLLTTVLKTVFLIIFASIYVYAIIVIPRFMNLNTLSKNFEETMKSTNYSYTERIFQNDDYAVTTYRKENIFKRVGIQNQYTSIFWINIDKKEGYIIDENNKTYTIMDSEAIDAFIYSQMKLPRLTNITVNNNFDGFMYRLIYAMNLKNSIKKTFLSKTMSECYVVDSDTTSIGTKIYLEKDTGLLIGKTGDLDEMSKIYEYKFENVTDKDIELPDLTKYTLVEHKSRTYDEIVKERINQNANNKK